MNLLFKALNDPKRRKMLKMLQEGDLTAGEIASQFLISKPSVSHHLESLREAGLIDRSRDGKFIRYSINMTVVEEAANWLLEILNKQ